MDPMNDSSVLKLSSLCDSNLSVGDYEATHTKTEEMKKQKRGERQRCAFA